MHGDSVNEQMVQSPDEVTSALKEFGFSAEQPRKRRRKSELGIQRWREAVKSTAPYQIRVETRPPRPDSKARETHAAFGPPGDLDPGFPLQYQATPGWEGPPCFALMGYGPVAIHTRAHWSTAYEWFRGSR